MPPVCTTFLCHSSIGVVLCIGSICGKINEADKAARIINARTY